MPLDLDYRMEFDNLIEHGTDRHVVMPVDWWQAGGCISRTRGGEVFLGIDQMGKELRAATMREF